MRVRSYSDLKRFDTFFERFEYLSLRGQVGGRTFGFDRWLNQRFYASPLWTQARDVVIMRDLGCDLGIPGREIHVELLVHHMNPITRRDITNGEEWILDPEYLITTCHRTHNAIHYGDASLLPQLVVDRTPGDTRLW
jgi:hypothetical protein